MKHNIIIELLISLICVFLSFLLVHLRLPEKKLISAGNRIQKTAILSFRKRLGRAAPHRTRLPMDIGRNILIAITLPPAFTSMLLERHIFTLKETTGGCLYPCLRTHCCNLMTM